MTPYLDASALLPMLIDEPGSRAVDAFIAQMDRRWWSRISPRRGWRQHYRGSYEPPVSHSMTP